MSRVEEIERRITALDETELRSFREWFEKYDADVWDKQIERDAGNGKLARLADLALDGHESGQSTEL